MLSKFKANHSMNPIKYLDIAHVKDYHLDLIFDKGSFFLAVGKLYIYTYTVTDK